MMQGLSKKAADAVELFFSIDSTVTIYVGPNENRFDIPYHACDLAGGRMSDLADDGSEVAASILKSVTVDTFRRVCQFAYFDNYNFPEVEIRTTHTSASAGEISSLSAAVENTRRASSAVLAQSASTTVPNQLNDDSSTSSICTLPLSTADSAPQMHDKARKTKIATPSAQSDTATPTSHPTASQKKRPYSLAFEISREEARATFKQLKIDNDREDSTAWAPAKKSLHKALMVHADVYEAADALDMPELRALALRHIRDLLASQSPISTVTAVLQLADIVYGVSLRNKAIAEYEDYTVLSRESSPEPPYGHIAADGSCKSLRDLVVRYIALEIQAFTKNAAFKEKLNDGGPLVVDVMSLLFD